MVETASAPAAQANGATGPAPTGHKRSPSTSTSGTVSRLIAQHTGGSLSPNSLDQPGGSRPVSPLSAIRAPSTMSVLKASDFARRKAAFQKAESPTVEFRAELEERYANAPSPLDLKELVPGSQSIPRGTFIRPKLRSASAHTPSSTSLSSSLPIPTRLASTSLTTSPISRSPVPSPAAESPVKVPTSTKPEIQVLELNKKLMDTTLENKTLAEEVSNMENKVQTLQGKLVEAQTKTEDILPEPNNTVPKAEFDALVKETERATKELEAVEKKAEESRKALEALAAQTAQLQTKTQAPKPEKPLEAQELAAKESLEQAVSRLREQVEVATRQSIDARRMSSSSRLSERYGPSSTRVAINRSRRPNASPCATPTTERADDSSLPLRSNRDSQVVMIAPAAPLPEREEISRSIKSYYADSVRATSPISPLPPIEHSDEDQWTGAFTNDMMSMIEGLSDSGFDKSLLSLNTPPTLVLPSREFKRQSSPGRAAKIPLPMSPPPIASPSLHSKNSTPSLKKKKGWTSIFKVKFTVESDKRSSRIKNEKAPVLAPISTPSPISFNP